MIYTVPAMMLLFAFLNRVRGGLFKKKVEWLSGGWIPTVALIAIGMLYGLKPWQAAVIGGLYFLGEQWGWTKWLYGLQANRTQEMWNANPPGDDTGREDGTHAIADLFVDERKNYYMHSVVGMGARALLWWGPVFAAFWWFGLAWFYALPMVAILIVTMPALYSIASDMDSFFGLGYLGRAEVMYGAVYGGVLAAAFLLL